LLTDKLKQLIL